MNRKEIAILSLIIFMTIIFWTVISIYNVNNKTSDEQITIKNITPLNPKFDTEIINQTNSREE